MTAYSITISQTVNVFGPAGTDNWNAFNWGAFLWGAGTQTLPKNVVHRMTLESISAADAVGKSFTKLISADTELMTLAFSGNLHDARGYLYVFPEQVTDISKITLPTWAAASSTPVSWTTQTVSTTTWS